MIHALVQAVPTSHIACHPLTTCRAQTNYISLHTDSPSSIWPNNVHNSKLEQPACKRNSCCNCQAGNAAATTHHFFIVGLPVLLYQIQTHHHSSIWKLIHFSEHTSNKVQFLKDTLSHPFMITSSTCECVKSGFTNLIPAD